MLYGIRIFAFILATMLLTSAAVFADPAMAKTSLVSCDKSSQISGKEYRIQGEEVDVYLGPGTDYSKVVNEKATRILKKINYIHVDNTVTVIEECSVPAWSRIRVIDPSYLSDSHRGWIETRFLKNTENIRIGDDWYSDWSSDFHLDISRTLSANRIRGCGEFRFRRNLSDASDFVVSCTRDGKTWKGYRVSTSQNKVTPVQ